MKRKIVLTILFVLTFLIGGFAGLILNGILFLKFMVSTSYGDAIIEMATDARQLEQGKASEVLKRKVEAIPQLTLSYYKSYYKICNKDYRDFPLWQVQRYYETTGQQIPATIKPILDDLPPRPLTSCELKHINDVNSKLKE